MIASKFKVKSLFAVTDNDNNDVYRQNIRFIYMYDCRKNKMIKEDRFKKEKQHQRQYRREPNVMMYVFIYINIHYTCVYSIQGI